MPEDLPKAARVLYDETFRRARHIVTENERVARAVAALEKVDLSAVGRLLTESHASMRDAFGAAGYLEPRVQAVVPSAGARKES
jgi:galactokinase